MFSIITPVFRVTLRSLWFLLIITRGHHHRSIDFSLRTLFPIILYQDSASSPDAHLWDLLKPHSHTHTHSSQSCIAPADISECSHLSLLDHCVLTLDCFSRFGLISVCLLTLLPALILCSCLSSDIPITDHCLYDC